MKTLVAIIGDSNISQESIKYKLSYRLGRLLVDNNYVIITGGRGGVMKAARKGGRSSHNYKIGSIIDILPYFDPNKGDSSSDLIISTGLDVFRNAIVANSYAVIAIGGGAGTLSEIAYAWQLKRMIIAYKVEGWSGKLANTKIDERKRIDWEGDKVFGVETAEETLSILLNYKRYYLKWHKRIS